MKPKGDLMTPQNVREIPLTKGKSAIVDAEDYVEISRHKWCAGGYGGEYATRYKLIDGRKRCLLMHREIMNPPNGMEVDHVNGNKLDNRKSNLRICTSSQNKFNRTKMRNNKSGYKGVCFASHAGRFMASIQAGDTSRFLGYFRNAESAAEAYKEAARELHGEFSKC